MGVSMKPGGGGRFKKVMGSLEAKGMPAAEAGAITANAGRKKYGDKKMAAWAKKAKKSK